MPGYCPCARRGQACLASPGAVQVDFVARRALGPLSPLPLAEPAGTLSAWGLTFEPPVAIGPGGARGRGPRAAESFGVSDLRRRLARYFSRDSPLKNAKRRLNGSTVAAARLARRRPGLRRRPPGQRRPLHERRRQVLVLVPGRLRLRAADGADAAHQRLRADGPDQPQAVRAILAPACMLC